VFLGASDQVLYSFKTIYVIGPTPLGFQIGHGKIKYFDLNGSKIPRNISVLDFVTNIVFIY
jgi:hypothetical protein